MTHYEKMKALFDEMGLGYADNGEGLIELSKGLRKVSGYIGFVASFEFDEDGEFVGVGIYE